MGYIECLYHGGNVISFASKYHVDLAIQRKNCLKDEVLYVEIIDSDNLFNGEFLADRNMIKRYNIKNFIIDRQVNERVFESFFLELKPVCSKCLAEYLDK